MATHKGDGWSMNFKGTTPRFFRKLERACILGINEAMAEAVAQAKSDHPGWNNISGDAEGSVQILQMAAMQGARCVGVWGSVGVYYVFYLEFLHGSFLRHAGDATYPDLPERIRRHMRGDTRGAI